MKGTVKQRFRAWLSLKVYLLIAPHAAAHAQAIMEEALDKRIPREGTTHALACHTRDQAGELERRLDWLDGHLVVDSRNERG